MLAIALHANSLPYPGLYFFLLQIKNDVVASDVKQKTKREKYDD